MPAALDGALAGGLIEELPGPTLACRFTHELVRRAVYDRLSPLRRAELHLRVGEALERSPRRRPGAGRAGAGHPLHAGGADDRARAGDHYNIRAAEAAVNADAYAEAADRLSTALELGIQDDQARAHVQTELALVQRGLGRFDESEPLLAAILDEPFAASQARFFKLMNDPRSFRRSCSSLPNARSTPSQKAGDHLPYWQSRGATTASCEGGRETHGEPRRTRERLRNADASGRRDAYRWVVGSLAYVLCDGPVPVTDAIHRSTSSSARTAGTPLAAAILGQCKGGLSRHGPPARRGARAPGAE